MVSKPFIKGYLKKTVIEYLMFHLDAIKILEFNLLRMFYPSIFHILIKASS